MMVDPLFMTVQSLRLFLIAVTTTAVAPIAIIFTCLYLTLPEYIPEFTQSYLNLPKFTWIYLD